MNRLVLSGAVAITMLSGFAYAQSPGSSSMTHGHSGDAMAACPMNVPGAKVTNANTATGETLTFSTDDGWHDGWPPHDGDRIGKRPDGRRDDDAAVPRHGCRRRQGRLHHAHTEHCHRPQAAPVCDERSRSPHDAARLRACGEELTGGPIDAKVVAMMNDAGGWMNGWSGGGMWIWTVAGTLVVVLLGVLILRVSRK
jgi:hypothetical protein